MSRSEELVTERRRRNSDSLAGKRRRLHVNEAELDRENFTYRFVNDEGNRLHDMTVNDDWELVSDRNHVVKVDSTGSGSEVAVYAGTQENGAPLRQVLLRKPRQYYEEDKAAEQRQIDEREAGIKSRGGPGASEDGLYQPTSARTTITRS
jgi:hypothetical protein